MALYGIYGKHTVEACPVNNLETAKALIALTQSDVPALTQKHNVHKIVAQYHSPLEHTLIWVVEAEDAHGIQSLCIESGLAAFNELKIVPLITFADGVIPLIKQIHGL